MPIQIRELVIRATVDEGAKAEGSEAAVSGSKKGKKGQGQEKIIRQCVDEVLEVLRLQNEY